MKRIALVVVAIGCIFPSVSSTVEAASDSQAKSSDQSVMLDKATWQNVFTGHSGELLRFDSDWTAEAVMRGLTEEIHFHEKTTDPSKLSAPPYEPKPQDYIPENFARMRLMELLVIPKNAPNSPATLRKLREIRDRELVASGVSYRILPPQHGYDNWPQDTFGVSISSPYRLFQQYSQDRNNFFILTTGVVPEDSAQGYVMELFNSLQKYLEPSIRQVSEDHLIYKNRRFSIPWVLFIFIAALIGTRPKQAGWSRRLRLIGRTMIVFLTALPLIGLSIVYSGWRCGLDRWVNGSSVLLFLCIAMPFLCMALSQRLGGKRPRRVFLWMVAIDILPAAAALVAALDFVRGQEVMDAREFWFISASLMILGLIWSVCFGLTHSESDAATTIEASR
jgi:hypothetical protein